jgi:hypothetical protein
MLTPKSCSASRQSACVHLARADASIPRLSAIRPLGVRTRLTFRLNPDAIINGVADPLLAAEVSLRRLHRHMSKQKLNLI